MKNDTYLFENLNNNMNANIDKSVLPMGSSCMSYNFSSEDGVLKDGIGIKNLQFRYSKNDRTLYKTITSPEDKVYLSGCWCFRAWDKVIKDYKDYLIFYATNGNFYYNYFYDNSVELTLIDGLKFEEKPLIVTTTRIDGEDALILISDVDGMYIWKFPNTVQKVDNAPKIKSMCVNDGRIYATTYGDGRSVIFSDGLDPINFNKYISGGGEINIADDYFGKGNTLISFGGHIYIFRDYNIVKLTTYASRSDYMLSQLYVSNGLIYEKTICVCGDKVLYLASDGIYSFDGSSSRKLDYGINKLFKGVDNFYSVASYCDGYYYLSCNLNFDDNSFGDNEHRYDILNNALVKINVSTGVMTILRGCSIQDMSLINNKIKSEICVTARIDNYITLGILDESGCLFGKPTTKVWKSSISDFGVPEKNKVVKEVGLLSKSNIDVEIYCDGVVKTFKVKGSDKYQTIKPYVVGKYIGINFKSQSVNNYISRPKIVVGYL